MVAMKTAILPGKSWLSQRQLTSLPLLVTGMSKKAEATRPKKGEDTVWRWIHQNPEFQSELARRQEMIMAADLRRICYFRSVALQRPRRLFDSKDEAITLGAAKELLGVGVHSQRSGIRNVLRTGLNERVAMEISGHVTRTVFDRYNIVNEGEIRTALQKARAYINAQAGKQHAINLNSVKDGAARSDHGQKAGNLATGTAGNRRKPL